MAMMAAASMTQESGFHMNPRNLRIRLSSFSSSLLGLKTAMRACASSEERPCLVHFRVWKTSSTGMFSCHATHHHQFITKKGRHGKSVRALEDWNSDVSVYVGCV